MRYRRKALAALGVAALAAAAGAGGYYLRLQPATSVPAVARAQESTVQAGLQALLADYRKIIVLLADEATLDAPARQQATTVGQALFHDKLDHEARLARDVAGLVRQARPGYLQTLEAALDYIESGPGLFDADRLAFRETLVAVQGALAGDGSLPAIRLHKRIGEDLDALAEIERHYDREVSQIFNRFDNRAIMPKREKWADYVAHLRTLYQRERILKEYGVITPYTPEQLPKSEAEAEIFGDKLPAHTVALTFDDGPHHRYTEEISAILKQYQVPGAFFEVGRNLGEVGTDGQVRLGANARISRQLLAEGFALGNHSYTHAQLSKVSGDALKAEVLNTDRLLQAVAPQRPPLFRFPYGARNREGLSLLADAHLRSIMWNIDSLDWADPVPNSIADRVLRTVDKEGRGIILFHDIHERSVKALPLVLDRLIAEGYHFAGWDGSGFSVKGAPAAPRQAVTASDGNSWAVVIGINDYAKWPKLHYAVNDAEAVRQILVGQFGFSADKVVVLKDGEATRNRILATFHDRLAHDEVQRDDRIFVFFAGHGATRKLDSGREVGYLIPADAAPEAIATDAIPMTEIQNIAESLSAKHVFFVMDACYSGLGLTRGGAGNFLRDNAKRTGRQMLTAGGADQMVADGGPDGHSIFTWTLLQGLNGKGDLNGDGLITATELAAYVAPAVAGVSLQTPAFGSLPGSEGGEFVFELPASTEFLSAGSSQLSGAAIALNSKLEAAAPVATPVAAGQPAVVTPVKVRDLQGQEQVLKPVAAQPLTARQLAQRANDRGLQLYREKRYADAETAFTEALKLRPDFALAANNLGFVYYRQQQYAAAARWFEQAIKSDPSRAVAYLNLGDAWAGAQDKARAVQAYTTYLALAPAGGAAGHVREQLARLGAP